MSSIVLVANFSVATGDEESFPNQIELKNIFSDPTSEYEFNCSSYIFFIGEFVIFR